MDQFLKEEAGIVGTFDILSGEFCEPKSSRQLSCELWTKLPILEPSDHRVPVSLSTALLRRVSGPYGNKSSRLSDTFLEEMPE